MLTAIDRTAKPQTTYSYQIRTVDSAGNATLSDAKPFTTTTAGSVKITDYDNTVLSSQPRDYWALSEAQGTRANNWVRSDNPIALGADVVRNVPGAEVTGDGRASQFRTGTVKTGTGTASINESAAQTSMTELWFRSESTSGGILAASKSTRSSWWSTTEEFNRVLSLDQSGTVKYSGAAISSASTLASATRLNDGKWHHIVAGTRDGTSVLYVDGALSASGPAGTASTVSGQLRIGGGDVGRTQASVLNADIDNVALYSTALSEDVIAAHYRAGSERPNVPPTAVLELSADALKVSANGAKSTDQDGQIVAHSWSFGDGSSASGASVTHEYATAGTYTVELTVTDDDGAVAKQSKEITVAPDGVLGIDEFDRMTNNAWGTASLGGTWTTRGTKTDYSVSPSGGAKINLAPGASRSARLSDLKITDAEVTTAVTLSDSPTGGGVYPTVILRESDAGAYTVRAWIRPQEPVQLQLLRGSTVVARASVPGLTIDAGQTLNLRATISGQENTTVTARAWSGDSQETTTWPLAFTDGAESVRAEGTVGLGGYHSGTAVSAQVLSFDRVEVSRISAVQKQQAQYDALDADQSTAEEQTEESTAQHAPTRSENGTEENTSDKHETAVTEERSVDGETSERADSSESKSDDAHQENGGHPDSRESRQKAED
ncbi:MAG: PKD domain-containing protein [Mycetocola sp.]